MGDSRFATSKGRTHAAINAKRTDLHLRRARRRGPRSPRDSGRRNNAEPQFGTPDRRRSPGRPQAAAQRVRHEGRSTHDVVATDDGHGRTLQAGHDDPTDAEDAPPDDEPADGPADDGKFNDRRREPRRPNGDTDVLTMALVTANSLRSDRSRGPAPPSTIRSRRVAKGHSANESASQIGPTW